MELISVVIPIYNVGIDLDRCLKSICTQSYSNLEIILVNDGSTDDSRARCDSWANKDSRVKVIHKENGGVSSARNAGIDVATGEFITFVDPDDYLEDNVYSEIYEVCKKYDIVGFSYYVDNSVNGEFTKRIESSGLVTAETREQIIQDNYFRVIGLSVDDLKRWNRGEHIGKYRAKGMVWQFIFSTELIKKHSIYFDKSIILKEDEIFLLDCLRYAQNLKIIDKPYYNYVQRMSSISYSISDEKKLSNKFALLTAKNRIRREIIKSDGVDILPLYAASNTLSILEIGILCAKLDNGYDKYIQYVKKENVLNSVDMIPIELRNYKFNIALLFMKCHAYSLLYMVIKCFLRIGLNVIPKNIV